MSDAVLALTTHRTRLLAYVARRCRDLVQAEDVLQETWARVLEQAARRPLAQPLAYAYRVADSIIFQETRWRRSTAAALSEDLASDLPSPHEALLHRERLQRLIRILQDMPALRREVFLRRRVDGCSRQEIAEEFGLSVEAVKKHIVRALADLAPALEGPHGEGEGSP